MSLDRIDMASGSYFPPPVKAVAIPKKSGGAMKKFRRLTGHKIWASRFLQGLAAKCPYLFVHWQRGMVGEFA